MCSKANLLCKQHLNTINHKQPYDLDFSIMSWRSWWHIFHNPSAYLEYWFHVTARLKIEHILYVGQYDIYFMIQWFCTWDISSIDTKNSKIELIICWSVWPIFHDLVIFPYILKIIWWINVIFVILFASDTRLNRGKVSYISWSIFWSVFDGWRSYFGYWFRATPKLNSQYM